MPRTSASWSVNDAITAAHLQAMNTDLTDIYNYGPDRGRVVMAASGTALKIDIAAFAYIVGSSKGQYAGGTNITVTNTATNYVEIDSTGTIVINTSAFVATNCRLATVTCSGGVVTAISIWKAVAVGGTLGASTLINVETLAGTKTLASTDKFHQWLNPNATNRDVVLATTNMVEGDRVRIKNTSSTIGQTLTVKQSSTVIGTVDSLQEAYFVYDGSTWYLGDVVLGFTLAAQIKSNSDWTTTSATMVDIDASLTASIVCTARTVLLIHLMGNLYTSTAAADAYIDFYVGSALISTQPLWFMDWNNFGASVGFPLNMWILHKPGSGTKTVKPQWKTSAGTFHMYGPASDTVFEVFKMEV